MLVCFADNWPRCWEGEKKLRDNCLPVSMPSFTTQLPSIRTASQGNESLPGRTRISPGTKRRDSSSCKPVCTTASFHVSLNFPCFYLRLKGTEKLLTTCWQEQPCVLICPRLFPLNHKFPGTGIREMIPEPLKRISSAIRPHLDPSTCGPST